MTNARTNFLNMKSPRLQEKRSTGSWMSWAAKAALRSLLCFVATASVAADFPMPEAYAENELTRYLEAAAAFLNNSPESIYAPRVAFDALVIAKDNPKFLELRGDLEVSLIVDYPGSLHGGYCQRTLSDPKIAREVLQRIIRHYAKKPRHDFSEKYAEAFSRFIKQCGIDLIDDVAFGLESMLVLEHTDAAQLREVGHQNIRGRLKSDDSVVGFVNEATNALRRLQKAVRGAR